MSGAFTLIRFWLPNASPSLFMTKTRRRQMMLVNLRDLRGFVIPVRVTDSPRMSGAYSAALLLTQPLASSLRTPGILRQPRRTSTIGPLQERPQLADVLRLLELEPAGDETGGGCGTQDRCHEVVALRNELLAGHRVVDGAQDGTPILAQMRAVRERDLQEGPRAGTSASSAGILEPHLRPQSED
jgi:hypothetical protein